MNEFVIIYYVRVIGYKNNMLCGYPITPRLVSFGNYKYWYKLFEKCLKKLHPNMLDFDVDYISLSSGYV
jgi:hypothetical protein